MRALAALVWVLPALASAQTEPHNVVLLLADDMRADVLDAYGDTAVHTPHLDALAGRSLRFDRAYCMGSRSGAVCSPSRAMLLSGRQLFRFDTPNPHPGDELPSFPAALRGAGWHTFATGKHHNGKPWFHAAFTHGGALFFGGMGSHTELSVHPFDSTGVYDPDTRALLPKFSSTTFADEAIAFLRAHEGPEPFFVYVSFTAPHDPRTPPDEFLSLYEPERLPLPPNFAAQHPFDNGELVVRDERLAPWPRTPEVVRQQLAEYYGMISQLDHEVGRILAALDEAGHADDTVVVFTADHGLAVGSHGLMGKQNLYEHSMRVPLLVDVPGREPGASDANVYLYDLAPTILALAGVDAPDGMDGISLVPALRGEALATRDALVTAYKSAQRALTVWPYKLIRYPRVDVTQLFDLRTDPHEQHDLSKAPEHEQRAAALLEMLEEELVRLGDPSPFDYEVYWPAEWEPPR